MAFRGAGVDLVDLAFFFAKAEADRRHQKFLYQGATGKKTCQIGWRSGLDQGEGIPENVGTVMLVDLGLMWLFPKIRGKPPKSSICS